MRRSSWRTAACAVALGAGAAMLANAPAHAVTNGVALARPASTVPWVLSLEYAARADATPSSICTASAINPLEIITASHCVKGRGFFYLRVGANSLSGGKLVPIEAIRDNTAYNSATFAYDIAVMRPVVPLQLARYAHPASEALEAQVRSARPPALTLYGWGLDQRKRVSGRLNAATVRPQITQAKEVYGSAFNSRLTIAAGYYNPRSQAYVGACNGDSGGPLVTRRGNSVFLVGVVSFGKSGCVSQAPTVFTAVGNFASWLAVSARLLPRLAETDNRALPLVQAAPTVEGAPALGATLTCGQGSWSANARAFAWSWFRSSDPDATVSTGPTYVVTAADAGKKVYCEVEATSRRGSAFSLAAVQVAAAPEPFVSPRLITISGLEPGRPAVVGQTATCAAPPFAAPDVTTTVAWYASASPTDVTSATALPLAAPASLVITPEVASAAAGRYLVCQVNATNLMGAVVGVGAQFVPAA